MSTNASLAEKKQNFWEFIQGRKRDIEAVLPKHLTPDRMLRLALVAANQNPKILDCTPASVMQCLVTASSLGLEIGGSLGEAYLVPYKNTCTLIVGYRGYVSLARRSGEISTISAHCVYENDEFVYSLGLNPKLEHSPHRGANRGGLVAVYSVARFREEGVYQFDVMWRHEVDATRKRSMSANNGPWVTDFDEMARKTVVRRLAKYLPLSPDMVRAVEFEDTGHDPKIQLEDEPPLSLPDPKTRTQTLADKLSSRGNGAALTENNGTEEEPEQGPGATKKELAQVKSALNGFGLTDRQAGMKLKDTAELFGYEREAISLSQGKTTIPMETLEAMVEAIREDLESEQQQA